MELPTGVLAYKVLKNANLSNTRNANTSHSSVSHIQEQEKAVESHI